MSETALKTDTRPRVHSLKVSSLGQEVCGKQTGNRMSYTHNKTTPFISIKCRRRKSHILQEHIEIKKTLLHLSECLSGVVQWEWRCQGGRGEQEEIKQKEQGARYQVKEEEGQQGNPAGDSRRA